MRSLYSGLGRLPLSSLTVGSAVGSIKELFAKIQAIDAKHGKFDFAICVGDFFGAPKDATQDYTEDHELIQLLEGRLEGRAASVSLYVPSTQTTILQLLWNATSCKASTRCRPRSLRSLQRRVVC